MQPQLIKQAFNALMKTMHEASEKYQREVVKIAPSLEFFADVIGFDANAMELTIAFRIVVGDMNATGQWRPSAEEYARHVLDDFVNTLFTYGAKEPEPRVNDAEWHSSQDNDEALLFGNDNAFKPYLAGHILLHI